MNDNLEGITIEYFIKNGKRKRKIYYTNNKIKEKCYGILYDENEQEIYSGILKDGIPKKGKALTIYDENDYIIYKGDFESFQYNGKGILYNVDFFIEENYIKFDGIFKNNKYLNGILYNKNGYKIYEGEFNEDKYEGNGILYYEINNKIFYNGSFLKGEFKYGILYGLKNEIIYEGDFKKSIPKNGKNIKLYKLNGYLQYEGDISNYLYEGNGKYIYDDNITIFKGIFKEGNKLYGIIYKDSRKVYEGEFQNDKFNGFGKIYKLDDNNNYLFYEGNFENGEISGKGIKYYINGSIKVEGEFTNLLLFNGKYYDIYKNLLFEGEITPEIISSKKIILYNDKGENIYNDKTFNYSENYFGKEERNLNSILLSYKCIPGKTCLFERLTDNRFINSLATIGIDSKFIKYEYLTDLYKMRIWDTSGAERYRAITYSCFNKIDIFIIVFDLSEEIKDINYLIEEIKKIKKNRNTYLIYLVGNKLDISNEYLLEESGRISNDLIKNNIIDKYFEVSAKTGEGIDNFFNTLKIDGANFYMEYKYSENKKKLNKEEPKKKNINHVKNLFDKLKDLDEDLSQYLKDIEKDHSDYLKNLIRNQGLLSKFEELNKYINY